MTQVQENFLFLLVIGSTIKIPCIDHALTEAQVINLIYKEKIKSIDLILRF